MAGAAKYWFQHVRGTFFDFFHLGRLGPQLKSTSGLIQARNNADSSFVEMQGTNATLPDSFITKGGYESDISKKLNKYISLALGDARLVSTGEHIGAATSPFYDSANNRIEWAAGSSGEHIYFPVGNLPFFRSDSSIGFSLKIKMSKTSNVEEILYTGSWDIKSHLLSGSGVLIVTSSGFDSEDPIPATETVHQIASASWGVTTASIFGQQVNRIEFGISANASDVVRILAAWIEVSYPA